MEVYGLKDLALALFDCINNEKAKCLVNVSNEAEYSKVMSELMAEHYDAPITGLQAFNVEEGLITFESGSELWFHIESAESESNTDEQEELSPQDNSGEGLEEKKKPAESIDDFLNEFKVKS